MTKHRWITRLSSIVLIAAVAFAVGVMQPSMQASSQGSLVREMTILMGEMFFQASGQAQNEDIRFELAIPYRVTFRNVGSLPHRVKFGRGLIIEEGVPFAYSEDLFDGVNVQISGDTTDGLFKVKTTELTELDLDPGVEIDVEFTLTQDKQGAWELGCFVIGHYEAGMRANLVVE